jgi:hypothetical protein
MSEEREGQESLALPAAAAAQPTPDTPGSDSPARDNTAIACMKEDVRRPQTVVLLFYLTFAVLAIIGGVVLQFLLTPSPSRLPSPNDNSFEVLTLPGSNTNCNVRPDPDALQFCVMTWGCRDTPQTPGGRCGLGSGSVFYTGNAFICITPTDKKRILGASGVYTRSITTYSLTCAGQQAGTSSCLTPVLPKNDLSCSLFWPTLRSVISQNIPSTSNITDSSGSFQIQGAVVNDPNVWFNMCGFCSLAQWVEM